MNVYDASRILCMYGLWAGFTVMYIHQQCPLQNSKNLRTRGQVADAHYTIIYSVPNNQLN